MARPREKYWYALRIFKDMAQARDDFSRERIATFVPYRVEERVDGGVKYEEKPLIESLIFLKTTAKYVKDYWYSHYPHVMYYRDFATGEPGRIPDREMDAFRKLAAPLDPSIEFFDSEGGPDFRKGEAVLITDGRFKGCSGHIFRIGRDRKVIVSLTENFHFRLDIHPRFLQKLDQSTNA